MLRIAAVGLGEFTKFLNSRVDITRSEMQFRQLTVNPAGVIDQGGCFFQKGGGLGVIVGSNEGAAHGY